MNRHPSVKFARTALVALLGFSVLAACGGGSSDVTSTAERSTGSATGSTTAGSTSAAVAAPSTDLNTAVGSGATTTPVDTTEEANSLPNETTLAAKRERTPPTLALIAPTSSATYTTNGTTINLAGTVSDDVQVATVRWSSDQGISGPATLTGQQPNLNWTANGVALKTGTNKLTLTAKDWSGKTTSLALTVTQQATVPLPPTTTTLISDKRMIIIPNVSGYPAKGANVIDPITGLTVTRFSDKSELTGDYAGHQSALSSIVYSRYTPTNSTGEYVLVHGDNSTSAWIYQTSTATPVTIVRFKPALGSASRALGELNELRWDYTGQHPYRLYFVGRSLPSSQGVRGENVGMSFYYVDLDPATGTQANPVLIRDFTSDFPGFPNAEIMNDVEGDSSIDSRYWAWQVMNTTSGAASKPYAVFSYDKTGNQILGRLQRSCAGAPTPCAVINTPATAAPYMTRPNMVEMSPLGTRVVVDFDRAYAGYNDADIGAVSDGPKAFLPNFSDPIRIGSDSTHSGWTWGVNGEEMFVSQNNRNDWIEAVDIRNAATANCKLISDNSYGCGIKLISQSDLDGGSYTISYHFGKFYNPAKRGYVYMNTYDSTGYSFWGKNQNLLVQVNDATAAPSKVLRIGSTYNTYYDYRSEGSGALDFKAENVWTTGNWGYRDGRGDVVRIKLPSSW